MPHRKDRDPYDLPRPELNRGGLGGDYARDTHRGGFGDEYARDGAWSGAGRADQYARDRDHAEPPRESFRGRGPKNWRPSDERILETVNLLLTDHDGVDASEIDVTVENAEVTLNGMVGSRWEKRLADDIAHSCAGVRDVHNRLRIADREVQVGKARE
jgi:osmotically-inducible protein OsmY